MWIFLISAGIIGTLIFLGWILARSFLVYPIITRISDAEKIASIILSECIPTVNDYSYIEYINQYSNMYKQLYLTYEEPIIFLWAHNSTLVNYLMLKSEKIRCTNFIDTSYQYQEKYTEYQQFAICANYYM